MVTVVLVIVKQNVHTLVQTAATTEKRERKEKNDSKIACYQSVHSVYKLHILKGKRVIN